MTGYARRYIREIMDLLSRVPRQMLLLLKTGDCLRHIDNTLGAPTNTMVVQGSYAAKSLYQRQLKDSSSLPVRLYLWFNYARLVLRIHVNDLALWVCHMMTVLNPEP